MSDLVSVIIPVYNVEKYVADTLESVVSQSYSNLEIIVINDGSTDNSLQIVRKFERQDSRIKVIDKENEGLSVARELGISVAQGVYFVTIDSDDVISRDYIKELHRALVENDADISLCARKTFGGKNEEVLWLDKNIVSPLQTDYDMLEKKYNFIAGAYQMSDSWNKMYRRSFVVDSGVHFILPRQYNGTDLLFNYSLLLHAPKIVVVNKPLYFYRLTQNSRVRRKNKHLENGFKYILERLLEENKKCADLRRIENQIYAAYISMIKYASQDLSEDIAEKKIQEKIRCYKELLATIPTFEMSRRYEIFSASSHELKLFTLLLFVRSAKGIYIYYKVRELWRK